MSTNNCKSTSFVLLITSLTWKSNSKHISLFCSASRIFEMLLLLFPYIQYVTRGLLSQGEKNQPTHHLNEHQRNKRFLFKWPRMLSDWSKWRESLNIDCSYQRVRLHVLAYAHINVLKTVWKSFLKPYVNRNTKDTERVNADAASSWTKGFNS